MRVLVVGAGGREHALTWKIAQSERVEALFVAPGNAGMAQIATCVDIQPTDIEGLAAFAVQNDIELTVVGPEAPLISGIVDLFEGRGLRIFGPSKDPARIEGSKAFAKHVMQTSGIPTAKYWVCDTPSVARARLADHFQNSEVGAGVVIKADGLAAGKGVVVCLTPEEAENTIEAMMVEKVFGEAGNHVVIEERLEGPEVSMMVVTDGNTIVPLLPSQDHKRIYDNDLGPNTGGMGAYCPVSFLTRETTQQIIDTIIKPAVSTIRELGIPYRGALYAGIMLTKDGPYCIEFNCRFGDPETEAVLPMLKSDIIPLLMGTLDCTLETVEVEWHEGASVSVIAASGGYPGTYKTGIPITGLEEASEVSGCTVFHAGTELVNEVVTTAGGRVLAVTGLGQDVRLAATKAYESLAHIHFEGIQFRTDIGSKAEN